MIVLRPRTSAHHPAAMEIGDPVTWHGRVYRLVGFDPMSVSERLAYLEDAETGAAASVPADEVEPAPPQGGLG